MQHVERDKEGKRKNWKMNRKDAGNPERGEIREEGFNQRGAASG